MSYVLMDALAQLQLTAISVLLTQTGTKTDDVYATKTTQVIYVKCTVVTVTAIVDLVTDHQQHSVTTVLKTPTGSLMEAVIVTSTGTEKGVVTTLDHAVIDVYLAMDPTKEVVRHALTMQR